MLKPFIVTVIAAGAMWLITTSVFAACDIYGQNCGQRDIYGQSLGRSGERNIYDQQIGPSRVGPGQPPTHTTSQH